MNRDKKSDISSCAIIGIIMLLISAALLCGCSGGSSDNGNDDVQSEIDQAPVIDETIPVIEGTDVNAIISAINNGRNFEWEYIESPGGNGMAEASTHSTQTRYESESGMGAIQYNVFIVTGEREFETPEIWSIEITNNYNDGDYSIFLDAVNAINTEKISADEVNDWLMSCFQAQLNGDNPRYAEEKTIGDAIFEINIAYNDTGARAGTRDITLSIESEKYPEYRSKHVA